MSAYTEHCAEIAVTIAEGRQLLVSERDNLVAMGMPKAALAVREDIRRVEDIIILQADACIQHAEIIAGS